MTKMTVSLVTGGTGGIMKKSVICGLVLLLGFSALSAGDVASFVDKGFSEDEKNEFCSYLNRILENFKS